MVHWSGLKFAFGTLIADLGRIGGLRGAEERQRVLRREENGIIVLAFTTPPPPKSLPNFPN